MDTTADELAIRRVLAHYCRGLDRMDKPLSYSVFHPEATAHYIDMYEGSGHGFIDWVWESHGYMERHSHQISNVLVDIDGDTAMSEAYVTVVLWTLPDEQGLQKHIEAKGRYLDRWEKRDNQWAIIERTHVLDMQTARDMDGKGLSKEYVNAESRRDNADPSFELFSNFR